MSDLALVIVVAIVTFATRLAFMIGPRPAPEGLLGRFLDVFPLALFVALATTGLVTPAGEPDITPALAAAGGGVIGAIVFRRNLWGVMVLGAVAFYLARALTG